MVETVIDVLLAVLLLLSVIWSFLLHRRLARLRADRSELESFIGALAGATDRAEAAIGGLRAAGSSISRDLQTQEETARRSMDQLSRALEAASRTIRRLEQLQQSAVPAAAERASRAAPSVAAARRDQPTVDGPAEPPAPPTAGASRIPADVMRVLQALR